MLIKKECIASPISHGLHNNLPEPPQCTNTKLLALLSKQIHRPIVGTSLLSHHLSATACITSYRNHHNVQTLNCWHCFRNKHICLQYRWHFSAIASTLHNNLLEPSHCTDTKLMAMLSIHTGLYRWRTMTNVIPILVN